MEFNKIIRGANRAANDEKTIYKILDAGFLCHVAFVHQGQTMMIPTAYGRKEDALYFHGSTKNFMLNQIASGSPICVGVTHLDGIVLAKTLFDTSANYRSVVLFGKAELLIDREERLAGLRVITENIIKGRWDEVSVGTENQLKATTVVKFTIEKASAKIRQGGPEGDEANVDTAWSGHIPLYLQAGKPVTDLKFGNDPPITESVNNFLKRNSHDNS